MSTDSDLETMETAIGNRTDRRVNALRYVSEGLVTYHEASAEWHVAGQPVGGWDFRTFTELKAAGAFTFGPSADRVSRVDLAPTARGLLARWLD